MPLTFIEAYKMVCPNNETITPECKAFCDIMELMRQSGHIDWQDRVMTESAPRKATTVGEAMRYSEVPVRREEVPKVSKKEWLSVQINRDKYLAALNKKK